MRSVRPPDPHRDPTLTYSVWAHNPKVGSWLRIRSGLTGKVAVDEITARQDRVRRAGHTTVFSIREDGTGPPP